MERQRLIEDTDKIYIDLKSIPIDDLGLTENLTEKFVGEDVKTVFDLYHALYEDYFHLLDGVGDSMTRKIYIKVVVYLKLNRTNLSDTAQIDSYQRFVNALKTHMIENKIKIPEFTIPEIVTLSVPEISDVVMFSIPEITKARPNPKITKLVRQVSESERLRDIFNREVILDSNFISELKTICDEIGMKSSEKGLVTRAFSSLIRHLKGIDTDMSGQLVGRDRIDVRLSDLQGFLSSESDWRDSRFKQVKGFGESSYMFLYSFFDAINDRFPKEQ